MDQIISVQNVAKTFHQKKAVKDVSFSIEKGEVVAILGPNGAGKTTTISMLLGLLNPTQGQIKVFNLPPADKRGRETAIIYYLHAIPWQIPDFSVQNYLDKLIEIHHEIQRKGFIDFKEYRFFIQAVKP